MTLNCLINGLLGDGSSDIMKEAHQLGIIDKDESEHPEKILKRKDTARILHLYMKKELGVTDEDDITPASVMKDLYD